MRHLNARQKALLCALTAVLILLVREHPTTSTD